MPILNPCVVAELRLGMRVLKWWCEQECLGMDRMRMENQEEKRVVNY